MNREVYVELLNNPAHLEMALSLARLGSWHWQASNNQLYFDANMAALIGIEGAHPRRLGEFFRFARPEQAEAFIQQWEGAVTRGTEIAFQGLVRRGDESVCHLEIIGRPQLGSDNEVVAIAGAAQDVSQRVGMLQALQRSEERLRAIFEGSSHGILLLGVKGMILQSNRAFVRMVGQSATNLVGQRIQSLLLDEDEPGFSMVLSRLLADPAGIPRVAELRCQDGRGGVFWAEITLTVVRNEADTPHRIIAIVEDISERQALAAELASVRNRLARSRDRAQLFLAQELHDGPVQDLHAARFQLQALRHHVHSDMARTLLEKTQDLFQHSIDALRAIMGELRPPALAPFGLAAAIRSHAERFQAIYPAIRVRLDLVDDGQQLPDDTRLGMFRVTQELMNNVAKHAQANNIWVKLTIVDDRAFLTVRDDGIGFEPPDRLIELARAGSLGIIGVVERVTDLDGALDVKSAPGEGTTMIVAVPIKLVKEAQYE